MFWILTPIACLEDVLEKHKHGLAPKHQASAFCDCIDPTQIAKR